MPPSPDPPIRLVVQQPSLAKYRLPVLQKLAKRPGIKLKLYYGDSRVGPPNVAPVDLDAEMAPERWFRLPKARPTQALVLHSPQWSCATPQTADVLLLTWNTRYIALVPALLRARANGVATILWGHGASKRPGRVRDAIRFGIARLATALLFYTEGGADEFIKAGYPPDRIFIASNSLDQDEIQQARRHWLARPADMDAFQRERKLTPGRVLLFVARLSPARRLDLLVQAIAMLADRYPDLKAVIIGQGDEEATRLRQLAESLSVSERLIFTGAVYEERDLAPWFLSATAFCFPAGMGLSMFHAFGYGLPVITDDAMQRHAPEIEALHHGETGLYYRSGSAESFAEAIDRLLADPEYAKQLGRSAHQAVLEKYNADAMVDGIEQAVRYAASQRRSSATGRR